MRTLNNPALYTACLGAKKLPRRYFALRRRISDKIQSSFRALMSKLFFCELLHLRLRICVRTPFAVFFFFSEKKKIKGNKNTQHIRTCVCSLGRRKRARLKLRKGSLSLLETGVEGNGRNTREEIIRLLEVSPGDSGGHTVPIDRSGVSPMDPRSRGHSRIRWVCHDGSSQFVVTGDQHVFFELLILRPYRPVASPSRVSRSFEVSLTGQTESH